MRVCREPSLLILMLGLLGVFGCAEGCRPSYHPPHLPLGEAAGEPDRGIHASDLAVELDGRGHAAAAARDLDGGIFYLFRQDEAWARERVTEASVAGRPALDHGESGDAVLAAVVPPGGGAAPPVAALGESPALVGETEGDLVLFSRRGTSVWRRRPVASRALAPALVAGEGREVHLAFLQPSADGLFVVVYVRIGGTSLVREEVGRRAMAVSPSLALIDGVPLITYAADVGGPAVLQARGMPGGEFEEPRVLPTRVLGDPLEPPLALSWFPESEGGRLALVRSVSQGLMLHHDGMRARLDPRAGQVLLQTRFEGDAAKESRIVFSSKETTGSSQVLFGLAEEMSELVALAGGLPLCLAGCGPGGSDVESARTPRVWILPVER